MYKTPFISVHIFYQKRIGTFIVVLFKKTQVKMIKQHIVGKFISWLMIIIDNIYFS